MRKKGNKRRKREIRTKERKEKVVKRVKVKDRK